MEKINEMNETIAQFMNCETKMKYDKYSQEVKVYYYIEPYYSCDVSSLPYDAVKKEIKNEVCKRIDYNSVKLIDNNEIS